MDKGMMNKAIQGRRGKGFEVTISVQPSEDKETDLAPHLEHMEEEAPKGVEQQEALAPSDEDTSPLTEDMTNYDMERLQQGQPKSLMERAQKAAMEKKGIQKA